MVMIIQKKHKTPIKKTITMTIATEIGIITILTEIIYITEIITQIIVNNVKAKLIKDSKNLNYLFYLKEIIIKLSIAAKESKDIIILTS